MSEQAVILIRVSTQEQSDSGLGLAAQEERCRAYCTLRGLDLDEVITDAGVSAGKPLQARPGGRRLLKLTSGRRPRIRHVVCLKVDRAFRSAADCLTVTADWNRRGVTLHLVDFGGASLDLSSPMGRMFLTLAAGFAELERSLCSERTKAALAVKRGRGEFTGGAPPFGWRVASGGLLQKEPQEQKALSMIRRLRGRGFSFQEIADKLNERGVPHRGSGRWYKGRVWSLWKRMENAAA